MCAIERQYVIGVEDLRYIRIECGVCGTKVILDMQEKSALAEKHGFFAPKDCPGCRLEFDPGLLQSVDGLQRLYKGLLERAGRIRFVNGAAGTEE